jgi:hypothetical protein
MEFGEVLEKLYGIERAGWLIYDILGSALNNLKWLKSSKVLYQVFENAVKD